MFSMPYITKMEQNADGEYEMEGMFADVFFALQEVMNFSISLNEPPDRQWGSDNGDGTWTGMVGLLATGQVINSTRFEVSLFKRLVQIDVAPTDFTITQERSVVMTFTSPITQIYHSLFIRNPAGSPNYTAYMEPFHVLSWIALACFVVVTPMAVYLAVL